MILIATKTSTESFQEKPSQTTATWIMEQKLQEREIVTERSIIF